MKTIQQGIIVSIQGYSQSTTQELARNAAHAGAVAIRTDKPIEEPLDIPIIGLRKEKVKNRESEPYITHNLTAVKYVYEWADYVAIDYRYINENVQEISDYCRENNIPVVADIRGTKDLLQIRDKDFYFSYVSSTFAVFRNHFNPSISLIRQLNRNFPGKVIAEGGYNNRESVSKAYKAGAVNVCIGGAISDIYKLTRKFVTVQFDNQSKRG